MSKKVPRYSKQKLLDNSKTVFGETKEVVAGAFVGIDEDMTIAEAKKKIVEFKKREVK